MTGGGPPQQLVGLPSSWIHSHLFPGGPLLASQPQDPRILQSKDFLETRLWDSSHAFVLRASLRS